MGRSFKDFSTRGEKSPYFKDLVPVIEFPHKKTISVRLLGPLWGYVQYWFTVQKKDGGKGSFPKLCLDYDARKDQFTEDKCPFRLSGEGRMDKHVTVNAIVRSIQKDRPNKLIKPSGSELERVKWAGYRGYWKDPDSRSWTPVRVLDAGASLVQELQALEDMLGIDLTDPEKGYDLKIRYDKEAPPANRWKVIQGEQTPLTSRELKYLLHRMDVLKPQPLSAAKKEMESISERVVKKDDDKKSKRKRSREIEDNDDGDTMEPDDYEDRKTARRKKKKRKLRL